MIWFLNLKTKMKLTISFGSLLLLIGIIFLNTSIQIDTLWSNQNQQYEKDFKSVQTILKTMNSLPNVRMSVLTAIIANSEPGFENRKQKIETNIKRAFDNIENCSRQIEGWGNTNLQNRFTEVQSLFEMFTQTANNEVLPALEMKNIVEAKRIALGVQADRLQRIDVLVTELLNETERIMERKNQSSQQAYISALNISRLISIFSALLCISLIYYLNKIISEPLKKMAEITRQIASGNLNISWEHKERADEIGVLSSNFGRMIESLRNLLTEMSETINILGSSSVQISANASQLSASSSETATSISETTSTVEEVRQTTSISNQKAKLVAESSQNAVQISTNGRKSTEETIDGINKIGTQMESIADSIVRLSEQSRAISDIISTVNDIAEQTNLLAVNASIEAARAGDQGKGFAVVAQEIKSLADQSKQATTQVKTIIGDIQNAISGAVMATEQGSKIVEAGIKQSTQTVISIQSIAESITAASQLAIQISASSQEQTVGMDQVALAMESIKIASAQNTATTKQLEVSARDLKHMGDKLAVLIKEYKL